MTTKLGYGKHWNEKLIVIPLGESIMIVETTEELNDKTISLLRAEQPKRYNALTKPELDRKWTEIDLETFLGEQIYSECKTLEITANPRTPKENNTINSLMAALWVMAHPKEFTPLARLFIKNIEHITFSQFKQQLYKSVMAFNQKLMQLPEGQRDYFIFLPPGDKKSNSWVLSLALPYLAIPPVAIKKIGGGTTNKDTLTGLFSNHNHVEIGLYIDDACYSGSQANGMLDSVNQYKNANFKTYLCIPYLGKIPQLENKISDGSVLLLPHHRMLSFLQKLAPLETGMTEEELNKKIPGSSLTLSQTYFDHKVAVLSKKIS